jgi:hypothetical protein
MQIGWSLLKIIKNCLNIINLRPVGRIEIRSFNDPVEIHY